jgi:hypothetical protein
MNATVIWSVGRDDVAIGESGIDRLIHTSPSFGPRAMAVLFNGHSARAKAIQHVIRTAQIEAERTNAFE